MFTPTEVLNRISRQLVWRTGYRGFGVAFSHIRPEQKLLDHHISSAPLTLLGFASQRNVWNSRKSRRRNVRYEVTQDREERQLPAVRPPRRKRWRIRIAVLSAIVICQEIVSRLLFPLPEVDGFNRIRYQRLAPGDVRSLQIRERGLVYDRFKFESQLDGFSEIHRLNLYGFRGNDFKIESRPGKRRILMLGDSVVEGQGAPEEATISSTLTKLLVDNGTEAEVINLGVVGADLMEVTLLARDSVALLKPTDVILVLYANDLPAPPYSTDFDLPAPDFPRHSGLAPRLLELFVRLGSHQPVYRRWPPHPTLPFFLPVPDPANPWTRVKDAPPGLDREVFEAMRAARLNPWLLNECRTIPGKLAHDFSRGDGSPARYLKRIVGQCAAIEARLIVAYVPFCGVTNGRYSSALVKMGMDQSIAEALHVDPVYRRQNEFLASVCRSLHLPLADTTEVLRRAEAEGTPQFWSFDTHPRPVGYANIASEIFRVWRQSNR